MSVAPHPFVVPLREEIWSIPSEPSLERLEYSSQLWLCLLQVEQNQLSASPHHLLSHVSN